MGLHLTFNQNRKKLIIPCRFTYSFNQEMNAVKMKGVEWNVFYNDPLIWERGVWHDDLLITVDGREEDEEFDNIDPKATVTIESGVIYFNEDPSEENSSSVESVIRKWRKNQKFKTICVEVPNEMFYAVCEQLKKDGCKIIK